MPGRQDHDNPPNQDRILPLLIFLLVCYIVRPRRNDPGSGHGHLSHFDALSGRGARFMRGLLLLHLFEYDDAASSFIAAEKADPGFAMAYWGEAMTFNHPVWNEVDVQAGQAALAKFGPTPEARAQRIADPRERAWFSAVEILYSGAGSKPERDARYATAMQQLTRAYPKDDEAQLFYALALLGKSEGVRDVPTYLQAAAIAKAVFTRNPDHPGAAHYWIHAMDDPQHAAGALVAARALSKIAPSAAHAQHMCSHIFLALGMWDDVVRGQPRSNHRGEPAGRRSRKAARTLRPRHVLAGIRLPRTGSHRRSKKRGCRLPRGSDATRNGGKGARYRRS